MKGVLKNHQRPTRWCLHLKANAENIRRMLACSLVPPALLPERMWSLIRPNMQARFPDSRLKLHALHESYRRPNASDYLKMEAHESPVHSGGNRAGFQH